MTNTTSTIAKMLSAFQTNSDTNAKHHWKEAVTYLVPEHKAFKKYCEYD